MPSTDDSILQIAAERGANGGPRYNQPYRSHLSYILFNDVNKYRVNMNDPIPEIFETVLEEHRMTHVDCTRFADDVEFYAPGYLAMEVEGRAVEYDLEFLL